MTNEEQQFAMLPPAIARDILWIGAESYLPQIVALAKGTPPAEIHEGYTIARSLATLILVELAHRKEQAAPKKQPEMN